ncbi:hypothetical protein [Pseudoalteromonas sp. PS5]|uniref:hypothetical protein n=1 Tax=Pseudoalteromonas sp. PS5 TaxID=1437473 RepID=UPI000FFF1019|nr:hypothetical protein [Pseudoalteromonas sp. PS5]RXE95556.1 hypothetical protein D9603_20085 [Pseudoalteromonas sp. PS5]
MKDLQHKANKLIELTNLALSGDAETRFEKAALYAAAQQLKLEFEKFDGLSHQIKEPVIYLVSGISEIMGFESEQVTDTETLYANLNQERFKLESAVEKCEY